MVLVDGSDEAERALHQAVSFKRDHDTLLVVHAVEFLRPLAVSHSFVSFTEANLKNQEQGKLLVAKYLRQLIDKNVANIKSALVVAPGSADNLKECVLKFAAKHNVDTIFVGTRGYGPLKRFFTGSFSSYIINHAQCNVMLVKH